MNKPARTVLHFLCLGCRGGLAMVVLLNEPLSSQGTNPGGRIAARERQSLSEPYKGVVTSDGLRAGLFPIHATGVSTEPVRQAAEAFLAGLRPDQRQATTFPVDDVEWRKWANQHAYTRQGMGFRDMDDRQKELAFSLLRAGLSAKGLETTRRIMHLNETLGEMISNLKDYGEWLYWITIMGEPSPTEPWGWQLDGHHVVINYFVLGDQVVMTPTFMGSEPVIARSGKYKGTQVLEEEQETALAMFHALDRQQQAKAKIGSEKTQNNTLSDAFHDNIVLDYVGISAKEMTAPQQEQLLALIGLFVSNMDGGHARVKMDEVRRHMDETYLGWLGDAGPGSVFYYRIHSPVILIEFDHQLPTALPGPRVPGREHIHTVVRTPNGNDYGKDLLRQHYEESHMDR